MRSLHPGRPTPGLDHLDADVIEAAAPPFTRALPDTVTLGDLDKTRDLNPPYDTTVTVSGTNDVGAIIEPHLDDDPDIVQDPSTIQFYDVRIPHDTDRTHAVVDKHLEVTGGRHVGLILQVDAVHDGSSTEPLLRMTCRHIDQGDG